LTQDERKLLLLLVDCVLRMAYDQNWPLDEDLKDDIGKLVDLADALEAEMPEPDA
jgi:hypothetical protein